MKYNKNYYKNKHLCEAIEDYIGQDITSLHMPSHKNNHIISSVNNLLDVDFTEISGLDNLQNPQDTIKKTQNRIKTIYGTHQSYMLVNGSTVGIMASILGTVKEKELILISSDCHKSVLSAIELSSCHYGYIFKDKSKYNNYTDFDYNRLEEDIKKYIAKEKVKALCVTSPSYEGVICDIKKLSKICQKYGILLIVDEAHGAHFNHNKKLPYSSINMGADLVIQSLHKTMPSLTQTALLHICSDKINKSYIEKYLFMLQTSSPSYIFMYTIDKLMENINSIDFVSHNKAIINFREQFKSSSNGKIKILDKEDFGCDFYDFTRLVIYSKHLKGLDLHNILLEKYKFNFEMSNEHYVIGITSPFDNFEVYDTLKNALLEIERECYDNKNNNIKIINNPINHNIKKFPKETDTTLINLDEATSCVLAENIVPYPPGIPVLCSGDILTQEDIATIKTYLSNSKEVIGIYNKNKQNKIKTFI